MAVMRKKQDDKNLKVLRELVSLSGNKQCFDCGQRGPTYVNTTIGSFVCTRCSGILRGLTPPHRVKSISMATFTGDEIDFLKNHGNEFCAKTWLGLWDAKRTINQEHREFMIDKYERKRYYLEPASPLKSLANAPQTSTQTQNQQQQNSTPSQTDNISWNSKTSNLWPLSSPTNGNEVKKLSNSLSDLSLHDKVNNTTSNATNASLSQSKLNGFGRTSSKNDSNVITKNSFNLLQSAAILEKVNNQNDFVADFGSADIFNAVTSLQISNNGKASNANGSIASGDYDNTSTSSGVSMSNGNGGDSDANANFADFDHNPIYTAAVGLPFPSSGKMKSSIASNSNSSVDSMLSADRYAALKDLDEQFRETKDRDNANTHFSTATPHENFFGFANNNHHFQTAVSNPFQSAPMPTTNGSFGTQMPFLYNGASPTMFATQQMPGTGFTNGIQYMSNGSHTQQNFPNAFGGNAMVANNGYPQKNPFAAPVLNSATNPFL